MIRLMIALALALAAQNIAHAEAPGMLVGLVGGDGNSVSTSHPLPVTLSTGAAVIGAVNLNDGSGNPLTSTTISSAYRLNVHTLGIIAAGATAGSYVYEMGGTDGTNTRMISTDTSGRLILGAGTNAIGGVYQAPNATSAAGIAPSATSALAGSLVLKASAGNLYGLTVTTSTVAGYVMLFNATSAPADGAVTPTKCIYLGAAPSTVAISWRSGPASYYSTGITAVFSTTGCFTKTASATAFLDGDVQ